MNLYLFLLQLPLPGKYENDEIHEKLRTGVCQYLALLINRFLVALIELDRILKLGIIFIPHYFRTKHHW